MILIQMLCLLLLPGDSDPSRLHSTIEAFEARVRAYHEEAKSSSLTSEARTAAYEALLSEATENFQPMMPAILESLGSRLTYVSSEEARLEQLLKKKRKSDAEILEMTGLLKNLEVSERPPRCALAFVIARLGADNPEMSYGLLINAVPLPEKSDDNCIIRALMEMGPSAYTFLSGSALTERDGYRAWIAAMALIAQAKNTEFPMVTGLGDENEWDKTFPRSRRAIRRLVAKWEKWWADNEGRYSWDPGDAVLKAR